VRARNLAVAAASTALAICACDKTASQGNFGFVYENGYGDKVDTFEGSVTKDMVDKPDTTIHLVLTSAEMDKIYAKLTEMDFFDLPEPHPAQDTDSMMIPHTTRLLRVQSGNRTKELHWDDKHRPHKAAEDEWKAIYELINLIRDAVKSHPEYQALPEPTAGYL
jgi:hypothetical protein